MGSTHGKVLAVLFEECKNGTTEMQILLCRVIQYRIGEGKNTEMPQKCIISVSFQYFTSYSLITYLGLHPSRPYFNSNSFSCKKHSNLSFNI